jgi:hypothetical protein
VRKISDSLRIATRSRGRSGGKADLINSPRGLINIKCVELRRLGLDFSEFLRDLIDFATAANFMPYTPTVLRFCANQG